MKTLSPKKRCSWCEGDPLYERYHDEEWGRPVHDDRVLFEFLVLEAFQAGLSWITILKKRENFRNAFAAFDPKKVSRFDSQKRTKLLEDAGIIRNRAKIDATIGNAALFLEIQKEFGSFANYVWSFTNGKTLKRVKGPARATAPESDALAKDLKKRGFKFLGPTVCYAFMQATGLVDDHVESCHRFGKGSKKR